MPRNNVQGIGSTGGVLYLPSQRREFKRKEVNLNRWMTGCVADAMLKVSAFTNLGTPLRNQAC